MSLELESESHCHWKVSPHSFGQGQALPASKFNLCPKLKFLFRFVYSLLGYMIFQTMFCNGIFYRLRVQKVWREQDSHQVHAKGIHIILVCSNHLKILACVFWYCNFGV